MFHTLFTAARPIKWHFLHIFLLESQYKIAILIQIWHNQLKRFRRFSYFFHALASQDTDDDSIDFPLKADFNIIHLIFVSFSSFNPHHEMLHQAYTILHSNQYSNQSIQTTPIRKFRQSCKWLAKSSGQGNGEANKMKIQQILS